MKANKLILAVFIIMLLTGSSFAQKYSDDSGSPDVVWFCPNEIYYPLDLWEPVGPGKAFIHIAFENADSVAAITLPLVWSGPLTLDSVTFRDSRVEYLEHKTINIDSDNNKILIGAVPVTEHIIPPGRGILATLCFTLDTVGSAYMDTIFFPPLNHLYFVTSEPTSYVPFFIPSAFPAIEYYPGDVDHNQAVEVADIIYVAKYVFGFFPRPPYLVAADINGDCQIELADAIYLANYLFKSGPQPVPGCLWDPSCAE